MKTKSNLELRQEATNAITALGYEVAKYGSDGLAFTHKGNRFVYFPYTGCYTGATIEDGRGLQNLLNQITK